MIQAKADGYGRNTLRRAASWLAVLLCAMLLAGCARMSEAEKKVAGELDALKSSDRTGNEILSLEESLSEEDRGHFDGFLRKLRDFDYEIVSSSEDGDYTTVTVKITTFDFGREYLAVWTDYLRSDDYLNEVGGEPAGFYSMLFDRLDSLQEKDCIRYVDIKCADPLGNGEWIADIKDNEELQDAIFGGMLAEMKTLAAEQ